MRAPRYRALFATIYSLVKLVIQGRLRIRGGVIINLVFPSLLLSLLSTLSQLPPCCRISLRPYPRNMLDPILCSGEMGSLEDRAHRLRRGHRGAFPWGGDLVPVADARVRVGH